MSFVSCSVCCCGILFFFFFFKQKTAYEMRISDWSSDVCSSDLPPFWSCLRFELVCRRRRQHPAAPPERGGEARIHPRRPPLRPERRLGPRSEERRVGKECVSTGRSRWSQNH